jgi:hypothetical protein
MPSQGWSTVRQKYPSSRLPVPDNAQYPYILYDPFTGSDKSGADEITFPTALSPFNAFSISCSKHDSIARKSFELSLDTHVVFPDVSVPEKYRIYKQAEWKQRLPPATDMSKNRLTSGDSAVTVAELPGSSLGIFKTANDAVQ